MLIRNHWLYKPYCYVSMYNLTSAHGLHVFFHVDIANDQSVCYDECGMWRRKSCEDIDTK